MMINDLTHDPTFLQYPDYTVEEKTTEIGNNIFADPTSYKHYHINAASYILLAKWFDYLRSNNVWDNTRIILVSDHGEIGLTKPGFSSFQNNYVIKYNPILLMKDFHNNAPLTTDNSFMTNADVPLMALQNIVENPVNPFTNNPLVPEKENGIYIFAEGFTTTSVYRGTSCLEEKSIFYHVRDNIYEPNNWSELKYRDFKEQFN
jgi:hypothetical protein